ncbi:MAG: glycosyltransferase WbuB [Myxococcales bacterium]|nr:MAG: glycosyltransferase WbuB [Myxococcales bacterium]
MANVLILSLVFPPDSVSTAQIMGELGVDLQAMGHKVTVLTTAPHFNRDPEAEMRQPIRNHWGPVLRRSDFHGIPVYHTFMPRKGKSILLRLLGWTGFHLISAAAGMTTVPRPDVIIAPSPPLTIGVFAWILGKFHGAPYIYNVQEIYPDIAVRLGALRNKRLIGLLERLERFVYRKGEKIAVIAPRMRQRLLDKGVPSDKVEVLPNFVDIGDLSPLPKDNDFSRRHGIQEKFVVSYAGNMGPAQGLESFIDSAGLLRDGTGIHFMMMGDGSLRESLRKRVEKLGLDNFTFLPYQPYSTMPQIYAASDICLVPQTAQTGCDAIPSKVYRIMACARPVLAITDTESDLAHLIRDAGCGVTISPERASDLADVISNAYLDQARWKEMGRAGCAHVIEHYSRPAVTHRYHDLVQRVING